MTVSCSHCAGKGVITRPYIAGVCNVMNNCPHCKGEGECDCRHCVEDLAERQAAGDLA